jgi:hypothetical protein
LIHRCQCVAKVYSNPNSPLIRSYATWSGDRVPDAFKKFAEELDFAISFHGPRLSAAILLLRSGVDLKTTAVRLDHNPTLLLNTHATSSVGRRRGR